MNFDRSADLAKTIIMKLLNRIHPLRYFFLSLFFVAASPALLAQSTVIKAGHLFDARSGKVLDNQIIVVKNGQIAEVGPNAKYAPADTVIDLSNSWVLPGLMDCHVHITSNYPYRKYNGIAGIYATESTALRALRGAAVAKQLLEGGFTTIKDIGNDAEYATGDVIKAIRAGWAIGPTIYYSGKIIAPYGGQSQSINSEHEGHWKMEYIDADGPDEIRKAVRKNIYHGANVIKMVADDQPYFYREEDIKAAVDEAKRAGMKVTVHVMGGEAARNVILGGAAAIEHGFQLDDELLRLMKERGTFLVGTDLSAENFYGYGGTKENSKAIEATIVDRLKRAYRIGTKMAFGTDVIIDIEGMNRLQSNLRVLQTWKKAEIPAAYILQTMTIHAAELLGTEKNRGVIEPNFLADIIAVKADPAKDIDAVSGVHFVMKNGRVIRNDRAVKP
jgi:imidazolonepropionase-like amidohydrolase